MIVSKKRTTRNPIIELRKLHKRELNPSEKKSPFLTRPHLDQPENTPPFQPFIPYPSSPRKQAAADDYFPIHSRKHLTFFFREGKKQSPPKPPHTHQKKVTCCICAGAAGRGGERKKGTGWGGGGGGWGSRGTKKTPFFVHRGELGNAREAKACITVLKKKSYDWEIWGLGKSWARRGEARGL